MDQRVLGGRWDEQHAEVSEEASVQLVPPSAGGRAGTADDQVVQLLPEQLLPVVQAAKVQELSVNDAARINHVRA